MSLASRVSDLATAIGNHIKTVVAPMLLPTGGTPGQIVSKSSEVEGDAAWIDVGTAFNKNIHIGTTAPSSPVEGDIWIDTN